MAARKFEFRLTRGGWALLLVCVLLTLGAFNTGLNMTYLLASLLIAILLASMLAPIWSVQGLVCRRAIRDDAFAGEPFEVHFWVYSKRRTTARLVWIEDPLGTGAADPVRRARRLAWRIPPREPLRLSCMAPPRCRGVHPLPGLRWSSRFPFGLAECVVEEAPRGELLVYPARGRLSGTAVAALRPRHTREGALARSGVMSQEFRTLREYRSGDSLRLIHWRASAHLGRLCVRETERERTASVLVLLDSRIPASLTENERSRAVEALELAISYVAELGRVALEAGNSVTLVGFFPDPQIIQLGAREDGSRRETSPYGTLSRLLEALARLTPADAESADALSSLAETAGVASAWRVLAVTPTAETARGLRGSLAALGISPLLVSDPEFGNVFRLLPARGEAPT